MIEWKEEQYKILPDDYSRPEHENIDITNVVRPDDGCILLEYCPICKEVTFSLNINAPKKCPLGPKETVDCYVHKIYGRCCREEVKNQHNETFRFYGGEYAMKEYEKSSNIKFHPATFHRLAHPEKYKRDES